jgi:hypothetical protein
LRTVVHVLTLVVVVVGGGGGLMPLGVALQWLRKLINALSLIGLRRTRRIALSYGISTKGSLQRRGSSVRHVHVARPLEQRQGPLQLEDSGAGPQCDTSTLHGHWRLETCSDQSPCEFLAMITELFLGQESHKTNTTPI